MRRSWLIAIAGTLVLAGWIQADIVSLNFYDRAGGLADAEGIDGAETYGVASLGTVAGNWNNAAGFNIADLELDNGTTSTVGFVRSAPNDEASFNAAYDDTPMKAGYDSYDTSDVTITLNNLNANFTEGYFIVAYLTGFNANTGASIGDGTSTFYFQTADPANSTLTLTTQSSDLGDGNNPEANYAVFGSAGSPLTSDDVTLTLDTLYGGGSGFGGLQIVAIPEPSSLAYLLLVTAALWIRHRRSARAI